MPLTLTDTALSIVILIIVVIILVLVLLLFLFLRERGGPEPGPGGGGPPTKIPDTVDGPGIAPLLTPRLAGTPADGSPSPSVAPGKVVWVDGGDAVLVYLDSTTTQIVGQTVLVSIDLESDQTGRTPLIVAFALPSNETAGLVVATDEYPRGNGLLASRWGAAVQAAAWSALLSLANDHATERELAPRGLTVSGGQLHLVAGPRLQVA
jgi:hypothetical protein